MEVVLYYGVERLRSNLQNVVYGTTRNTQPKVDAPSTATEETGRPIAPSLDATIQQEKELPPDEEIVEAPDAALAFPIVLPPSEATTTVTVDDEDASSTPGSVQLEVEDQSLIEDTVESSGGEFVPHELPTGGIFRGKGSMGGKKGGSNGDVGGGGSGGSGIESSGEHDGGESGGGGGGGSGSGAGGGGRGGGGGGGDDGGGDDDGDDDDDTEEEQTEGEGGEEGTDESTAEVEESETEGGPEEGIKREHNLPDKPTFFQVRVRIIKACHLPGGNIDPSFRVTVDTQKKQTKPKKSTSTPFFDESFVFNFNEHPNILFEMMFKIEAFNTKGLLSSTLLSSFTGDAGMVYFQKEHAIVKKWILLVKAEDTGGGRKGNNAEENLGRSPAGYVQVTVAVLGPGDELPDKAKGDADFDDTDDLESNIWMPGGVKLSPATFFLKVYRVEDLPQMDSEMLDMGKLVGSSAPSDNCDPYCKFSFAGKRIKTAVKLKTYNPEYNAELRIPFKFPSMCEKLRMQIYDWDRIGSDDIIATTSISMSQISTLGGSDFLPSFGPCFINFYGSSREFSAIESDHVATMNEGLETGAYYRGRALVELSTKLGNHDAQKKNTIRSGELLKVRPHLKRRKYKLYATFVGANGIVECDGPISFEVSIGNYGNSLDTNSEVASSTTPAMIPKYDGTEYYHIPWNETKPCCVVTSHWEDVSFRLQQMNMLRNIELKLARNIEMLELAVKLNKMNKGQDTEVAQIIINILDQLIDDCKCPIPQFNDRTVGITKLDLKMQEIRVSGLETLLDEAVLYRTEATDITAATTSMHGFLSKLKDLCVEPQNSLPDVVISMLKGDKRLASCRIPSADVLFSNNPLCKGVHCGRLQNIVIKAPGKKADNPDEHPTIPASCDVIVWLGLEEYQNDFIDNNSIGGSYSVFAETYENQVKIPIKGWSSDGCPRPAFSDSAGEIRLSKEYFQPPDGWKWDDGPEGEWCIGTDKSLVVEADEGRTDFTVEIYENESRNNKGTWTPAKELYTDADGDPTEHKDQVTLPDTWDWTGDWAVDMNMACDEEGWEYKATAKSKGWSASMKPLHKLRRRRLTRARVKQDIKRPRSASSMNIDEISWGYSLRFANEYHSTKKSSDMARRRRWVRKMIVTEIGAPPLFTIPHKNKKSPPHLIMPNMVLSVQATHKWQLRAYIYQARNLPAMDDDGFSDPYVVVCFQHQSQKTRVIRKCLCPEWDQSLVFENLHLCGSPEFFMETPPYVCVNLYDKDIIGKDDLIGRCLIHPVVRLDGCKHESSRLLWYPISCNGKQHGELLAAFELFLDEGVDLPFSPPTKDGRFIVPNGIRPVIVRTGFELLCWGVRNLKKLQLAPCTSPSVSVEIGNYLIQSDVIKNTKKNPNFTKNVFFLETFLPKEPLYMPPIKIVVRDHRSFGRKPIVGTHVITDVYLDEPPKEPPSFETPVVAEVVKELCAVNMPEEFKEKEESEPVHLDWWSKYYASVGEVKKCGSYLEDGYRTIQVYRNELEEVEEFGGFKDFVDTFPLERGKSNDDEEDGNVAGEFKGVLKIYPLPTNPTDPASRNRYFFKMKEGKPEECIVRVYIIRAYDLTPTDDNGLADPYLVVKLGNKKLSTKDRYIPNELNPYFGEYFEFKCEIPVVKDLKVKVYDYDLIGRDDFIGETTIDLEDRLLTKARATVGLPPTYYVSGPYKWRDSKKPKEILESLSETQPVFVGDTRVIVDGIAFDLFYYEEESSNDPTWGPPDERLALHVLHEHTFAGIKLVPEHVETRSLLNPLEPNMDQGQVEMFVDLFPLSIGEPGPPVNITPRQPKSYELRVVVWNTAEVPCIDKTITGDECVDIFLKGWIDGHENKAMKTDVHYSSLNGDGMFNWRLLFPFKYMPEESVMIVEKKEHFWSLDKTRKLIPPKLNMQVWDHDMFSPNEYIGSLELNLCKLILPKKTKNVSLLKNEKKPEYADLFRTKIAKGWWVMSGENTETGELEEKGKVEMTLEIVSSEEAKEKEAGKGREDPNMYPTLEKPDRPTNRFGFLNNPFKAILCVIWKRYKWLIVGLFFICLMLAVIVVFGYNAIAYGTKSLLGA